jgi:TRAP-type C4-dicarboxylate transport system substrate-binding protein
MLAKQSASVIAIVFGLATATLPACAQTTTLTFSSWLPTHFITQVLNEFGADLEKETNGRIKYKMLPQPVAPPGGTFDAVKDGLADVSWSVPGMTPGRFALTGIGELPLLGNTSETVSVAFQRLYQEQLLPKSTEFQDLKVLTVFATGPGDLFTVKRPARTLEDFAGLKVRVSGGISKDVADALNMAGILKPVSESYEILSGGIVDGTFSGMDGIPAFKIDKVVKFWTKSPGGLYRTSFGVVMNQDTYNKLSAQDKAAVDRLSGERLARKFGQAWDKSDKAALQIIEANKIEVVTPDDKLIATVRSKGLEKPWLEAAKQIGVDGPTMLKTFQQDIAKSESSTR